MFYVLRDRCVACAAPEAEAPMLVSFDCETICGVHRQPETPREVNAAIRAMLVSCVDAYRYGGTDGNVLRRLAELGLSHLCDHPLVGHPVIERSHVRFTLVTEPDARAVARLARDWFAVTWQRGCTTEVTGDALRASFEHTPAPDVAPVRRFAVEHVAEGTWLLFGDSGVRVSPWLHDHLIAEGATNIRWFSREQWDRQEAGTELPY